MPPGKKGAYAKGTKKKVKGKVRRSAERALPVLYVGNISLAGLVVTILAAEKLDT